MPDSNYLLDALQLLPLCGAAILWRARGNPIAWLIGLTCGLGEVALAIRLYLGFDLHQEGWQWAHRVELAGSWLVYTVGADGITVLFVLLTAILTLVAMLYGGLVRCFDPLPRYLAAVLACEAVLMGQFVVLDLLWFVLLALLHTLLIGHLLNQWSGGDTEWPAIVRYYQFMATSLLLLLAATLMLGWHHADVSGQGWRFELEALSGDHRTPYLQNILFYLLFYGLAIRLPVFPLHGWLPVVMEHGTVATAMVLMLGVKAGLYGMVRFLFPLFPDAVWQWHTHAVAIAALGIFYSALLALVQRNLRKLLAYAVISHTGILIIGLFTLHHQAFQGVILLTATFGLAISTLALTAGMIHLRTRTQLLPRLGGLFARLPLVGSAFLVAALSVVGMPLTPGFDAVHLLLEAAIDRQGALITVLAALGNVAAAACLLWAFQRAFLATPGPEAVLVSAIPRASRAETMIVAALIAVQLLSGFHTDPWLDLVNRAAQKLEKPFAQSEKRP
ncbi:MAG: NADH-quinone oxidoreductase subunit M [Magnetococcales bacterium]|nr:NADH-quinone oxidoreductase subunit M [Magnetococcales bacterium]